MKIIVCGAGQVGFNIARHLSDQQHDVTVIDRSGELIRKIQDSLDVQAIEGYASDPALLDQAGAEDAELLIAVTWSDEVNMIACQVADTLFQVPTKIARVRNQAYLQPAYSDLFTRDSMPIDVIISPEREVAEAIFRRLEVPGAFDMIALAEGAVRVVGVMLPEDCPILLTPLRHLTELFPSLAMRTLAIRREERIFLPTGDDHFEAGDSVYFTVPPDSVARAMDTLGHKEQAARRIIIAGGGNVGLFLAQMIEDRAPYVNAKVIEKDEDRAGAVADALDRTVVLHGDALDMDILREANVRATETIVTTANDDETNILSALLAKRQGCDRAIALVNNPVYSPLVGSLGLDVVVDPRETTVSRVLQHVRKGRIRAVQSLWGGAVEVLDTEVMETSPLAGKTVETGKLPDGVIVGAVVRDGRVLAPDPDTEFQAHDRVIMLAEPKAVSKVEQLFSVRLEFF
ncbi:Trk system potassium transport protein TrkA [Rhodothalassium salexigens]|uniref:Trk system potassium transporter TrkA n=1 Tax=Rhodothalassium salexigens TaxID=1086 RepID=UPI001913986C|nr:Trk system potassium transporter TrkA [Rhodothalassium salexigens]MBK5922043.1 Trk system potassium transport protein TrkA [Rhodothalassium salexigens]